LFIIYLLTFLVNYILISFITFAGLPATITLSGTSFVTTEFAATIEFSPIVTPAKTVTFAPSQTFLFICIFPVISPLLFTGSII